MFLDFNYRFDATKPSGFPKRVMDISLAQKLINYHPSTSLLGGLKQTWDWFMENQGEYLKKKNYFTFLNIRHQGICKIFDGV